MASNNHQNRTEPSNTKQVAPEKTGRKKPSTEFQLKKYLLLLATLVATVTYVAGLNLPGGVWQDTQHDHPAGDPILPDAHHRRYLAFYYCNATAFAASLVVCLLLLVLEEDSTGWAVVLQVVMALDLLGLMGAYAAGSCRDTFTTIYSSVLMSAVTLYIMLAFSEYLRRERKKRDKKQGGDPENPKNQVKKPDEDPGAHKPEEINNQGEKPDEDPDAHKREELHEVLMLLATFAVTITYVAGLNPPGGFWGNNQDGHRVSDPVLQDHHPGRYKVFFVCNTTAFVATLLIIMLLLDKKLSKGSSKRFSKRFKALYGLIVIALIGLVAAYTAGSCREGDNTAYVVVLAGAILAYIFLHVAITRARDKGSEGSKKDGTAKPGQTGNKGSEDTKEDGTAKPGQTGNDGSEDSKKDGTAKPGQTGNKGGLDEALEKARNLVMLLATLVASITYQAGLDPPGGLWPDDRDGHKGGDPVLLTTHPTRYKVFFYSNSTAFVASLVVIIMVQSRYLLKRHTLEAAMILDLFGLISAYAAGSCRDVNTAIYVVALAGVVLVYVVIHIIFFTLDHNTPNANELNELDNKREILLLLAILAATLTYQAGLTPPGGFWSADDKLGHQAGYPILVDHYPRRYKAFFYCNAASFMASVALILLLVNPNLYRIGIRCHALYVCMVAGMFGLMGAYAAGSSRHLRTSIYVLALVAAVFAFITLQVVIFRFQPDFEKFFEKICLKRPGQGSSSTASSEPAGHDTTTKGSSTQGGSSIASSEPAGHDTTTKGSSTQGGSSTGNDSSEASTGKGSSGQGGSSKASSEGGAHDTENEYKDLREYLMLLGIMAASVTYQTGLKPPGGLWQDNNNGHYAGNSILHDINKRRYLAFFYSNSTSFMASIVVIILLLPRMLHDYKSSLWPMYTAILLDMFGLLVAYAAGSARDWETSWKVILLVIPVLAYIAVYAAAFALRKKKRQCPK